MTDSLKLTEMQRTSIEFERQRHLANWFIKSSPHMASPPSSLNPNVCAKNGTITGNPLYFLVSTGNKQTTTSSNVNNCLINSNCGTNGSSSNGGGGENLALSKSQLFNSQTNLPLQIVTPTATSNHQQQHLNPEGRKPKLRRFNSHDTSSNMFSVADFENARLARRNENEMKQRQLQHQQRLKMNSLSSGCSTGDSKGSKYSNDSQTEPLLADIFLDRYSLPRVVRISHKITKFSHETLQSSSSNGSSSTQSSISINKTNNSNNNTTTTNNNNNNNNINNNCDLMKQQNGGELFLLYRHLRQRHIYHGFNTKTAVSNRKKGVMIPQEYPGYFSLINEKGSPCATMYTTLMQLVRERVYKFVSVDNLPAFTESQTTTNTPDGFVTTRPHYIKSTARGGQVFRLLAVFEDGKQQQHHHHQDSNSNLKASLGGGVGSGNSGGIGGSSNTISSGREKEKGRYAQLLNENRQILYVSLSAKGKFYEIEPSIPQILQKANMFHGGGDSNQSQTHHQQQSPKKLNPDCVHRICNLITSDKTLPICLKFISGPTGTANSIPENITINRISIENAIIACPIDDVESQTPLHLRKIPITNNISFMKCLLGFENEQRMLSNPNVQNILKFCQFNCDAFIKIVDIEVLQRPERSASKSRVDGLKILKPLNFPRLLRREKTTIAHEKEDSIIFLSKNDLANLESKNNIISGGGGDQQNNQNRISEKMKVFQSTKKKWFKRNDKHTSMTSLDLDIQAKRMSMERYSDMSKLLQERFGDDVELTTTEFDENNARESTTINKPIDSNDDSNQIIIKQSSLSRKSTTRPLQKSLSLQDVDFIEKQPDLLPSIFTKTTLADSMTNLNTTTIHKHNEKQQNSKDLIENCVEKENSLTNANKDNHEQLQQQPQQSFISDKLYSEFHVKTRQYSKSSSSLHQLLHFAVPQKMNVVETKKSSSKLDKYMPSTSGNATVFSKGNTSTNKKFDFIIGEPVHHDHFIANNGGFHISSDLDISHTIIDDLPYSSVRDSLLVPESTISTIQSHFNNSNSGSRKSLIAPNNDHRNSSMKLNHNDENRENIYAEICHNSNNSRPKNSTASFSRKNIGTVAISVNSSTNNKHTNGESVAVNGTSNNNNIGLAISRVQINGNSNNQSYPDVMIITNGSSNSQQQNIVETQNCNNIVNVNGVVDSDDVSSSACDVGSRIGDDIGDTCTDNIYNTLK